MAGELATAEAYSRAGLEVVRAQGLGQFLEGYAWESLARCHAKTGRLEEFRTALEKAFSAAGGIMKLDDCATLENDLRAIEIER